MSNATPKEAFLGNLSVSLGSSFRSANLYGEVSTFLPAEFAKSFHEYRDHLTLPTRGRVQKTAGCDLRRLLRARRERPRGRRAADERDELAAPHSITSSARASSGRGTVRPSALAVFKLMTSSYLVGACTGRSAP